MAVVSDFCIPLSFFECIRHDSGKDVKFKKTKRTALHRQKQICFLHFELDRWYLQYFGLDAKQVISGQELRIRSNV